MTDLPSGWVWTTLGEIGRYINGRGFKKSEWADNGRPIVRIQNLTGTSRKFNYFDGHVAEKNLARPGDLLMSWAASLGVHEWTGPEAAVNQHIFKVESRIDRSFHKLAIANALEKLKETSHGTGMVHVTRPKFEATAVPLPPLSEQLRIVHEIEDIHSCLDEAGRSLELSQTRARRLKRRILGEIIPDRLPLDWTETTVGGAGKVDLGMARHPTRHIGSNMKPYLRVANVFEDEFRLDDVKEMHFDPSEFRRYALHPGDVLLNEGQSPELLGRPALWSGDAEHYAFTNSLLRFRVGEGVLPRWALLVFRRHLHTGRFKREVRITTNIAHLSANRFKNIEFFTPPLAEQRRICAKVDAEFSRIDSLTASVENVRDRARTLFAATMTQAFRGELTRQDPADEPASVLLDRIRAERAAATPAKPARRPSASSPAP